MRKLRPLLWLLLPALALAQTSSGPNLVPANNLSDVASAATSRTNLGGTTVGQGLFLLTNPSAITFIRINADNTVTARSAANFKSDLSLATVATSGLASDLSGTLPCGSLPSFTGDVTNSSCALTVASTIVKTVSLTTENVIFSTPVTFTTTTNTASGTLALKTQTANAVLVGPASGSAAAPTFRALGIADVPAPYSNFVQLAGAGNWTVPAGVTRPFVIVASGGAGGGGVANSTASGSGGTSGENLFAYYTTTPGALIAYSVGAGGNGGAAGNNNGTAGGATTFGTITTLIGGLAGLGSAAGNAATTSTAALVAARTYLAQSASVSQVILTISGSAAGATGIGGIGGGCPALGLAGYSASANSAGTNAQGFCAGGGGATSTAGGAFAGGNGAPGTIIILY